MTKHKHSLWRARIRRFLRNGPFMMGFAFIFIMLTSMIFAPYLTNYDPTQPNFGQMNMAPNGEHIFGTDTLGRDIFSRILYGGRLSCLIALTSSVCSVLLGMILGCVAGYIGGFLNTALVRVSEVVQIFPQMILVLIIMAFLGQGTINLIVIFSFTGWTGTFRQVRAEVLSLREETYIEVSRSFGMSRAAIMFKQILPSVLTTVIIQMTMRIPALIISEAGLSYLGVGVPSSTPTWGNMINVAKSVNVIMNYWWMWVVPGAILSLFALSVNFMGDGMRDVLDPRQQ